MPLRSHSLTQVNFLGIHELTTFFWIRELTNFSLNPRVDKFFLGSMSWQIFFGIHELTNFFWDPWVDKNVFWNPWVTKLHKNFFHVHDLTEIVASMTSQRLLHPWPHRDCCIHDLTEIVASMSSQRLLHQWCSQNCTHIFSCPWACKVCYIREF